MKVTMNLKKHTVLQYYKHLADTTKVLFAHISPKESKGTRVSTWSKNVSEAVSES